MRFSEWKRIVVRRGMRQGLTAVAGCSSLSPAPTAIAMVWMSNFGIRLKHCSLVQRE